MKKFLFYFLCTVLLAQVSFAVVHQINVYDLPEVSGSNNIQEEQQMSIKEPANIKQAITLIDQAKYDEALRLIYSIKVPTNAEDRALYYLAKIKAFSRTPYRANKLTESQTDPTKFTSKQKQDAVKQAYQDLWNLRQTLINMPYMGKYLAGYYQNNKESLYDALVNDFINKQIETNTKVWEESYKLAGKNREGIREYWHIQYILAKIGNNSLPNSQKSENNYKEIRKEIAQFFAAIAGKNKNYDGKYKKYFFEAKTVRGKYEAALQSAQIYREIGDYPTSHDMASYCAELDMNPPNECKNLKEDLERPSASIMSHINTNQKPDVVLPIKFQANNLKQVKFKLYKLSLEQMQKKDSNKLLVYKTYTQDLTYDASYTPKDFTFELPALKQGFYAIDLDYDGRAAYWNNKYYFNVTELALLATSYFNTDNLQTLNYKDTSINFYTLSAVNGQPVASNVKAGKLGTIQTSQEGQTDMKFRSTSDYYSIDKVVANSGNNYALIDYLYPKHYNEPYPLSIYVNTDRAIYKPGQDVQIVLNVVALKDNKYFAYQSKETVTLNIRNASYKEVLKAELPIDTFGQATYTFTVPQDTMMGNFSINAKLGKSNGQASFQVEEFKQPEFALTLNKPDEVYKFNENITVDGKATYYSGEALVNAKVKYSIMKQRFSPCCFRWDGFDYEEEEPINAETVTDKDGAFKIIFKPKASKKDVMPARYLIKAEVIGTNGHTILGDTGIIVSNRKYFSKIEQAKSFFTTSNDNYLTLNLLNANSKPQKSKAIFDVFQAKAKEGIVPNIPAYEFEFDLDKEPLYHVELDFTGDEIKQKLPALQEGFYGAKLSVGEEEGQAIIFPVFNAKIPNLKIGNGITLAENKKYIVGENANILLGASKAKGLKFVEIYKNGFFVKRLQLSNQPLQFLILPILSEYQGGISLRWFGVYDYNSYSGTLNIEVPYLEKEIDVKLNVPGQLQPGQKATIGLGATVSNKPAQNARAIVTVYDKALDYYKKHNFGLPSPYTQKSEYGNFFGSLESDNYYNGGGGMYMQSFRARAGGGAMSLGIVYEADASAEESIGNESIMMTKSAAPMLAKNSMAQDISLLQENDSANATRTDFAPTAYFNPKANLQNGAAQFTFTMPDSLTEWTAAAIVFSKSLQTGRNEVNFKTTKDLTLRLETPTFLRQNDEIIIKTLLKNNTERTLQGEVTLTLKVNGKTVNAFTPKQVSLKANKEQTLTWPYKAPKELGEISLTAAVRAGQLTDGETRTLPLLTSMQYLPNSKTIMLKEGENNLQLPQVKEGEILNAIHLTLDTSLVVPVIAAMPMITEQEYKTATGTIDRYLPLAIMNQLYNSNADFRKAASQVKRTTNKEKWNKQTAEILLKDTELSPWYNISKGGKAENNIDIFNSKTVAAKQNQFQKELKDFQNKDGGFAWIKGGRSSLYITLYIVDRLAQASYFGVQPPMDMTQNALKYLKSKYKEFDSNDPCPVEALYFAYVISAFDKTLLVQDTREKVQALADTVDKKKEILAPLGQVYMATIYNRLGNQQKAQKYIDLLFATAKENKTTGISFAMEERSWQWFNDSLNLHAEALKMLLEVQPNSPKIDGLIKWLMFNKKATMWNGSTDASKAVYALLEAIKDWGVLSQNKNYNVAWNGNNYNFEVGPLAKENKTVYSVYEPQANNNALSAKIVLNTTDAQGKKATKTLPGFATLSDLVISSLPQEASPKGVLNITKAYYLVEGNNVRPLKENEEVKIGAKIEVRLTVKAAHNFDFVMIQDKKPAAFDTEKLLSGWVWSGLARYEDLQLAQTNFFMDRVPVGTYELKYVLRPTAEGIFNVGSSVIQSMFAPEVSAHSNSFIIKVVK